MIQQQAALVTGGSRGIGRAAALALARLGMNVAVNYLRDRVAAEEVVAAIQVKGRQGIAIQADVGDAAKARGLVARAIEQWGRLDVLVSNAGIVERAPVLDLSETVWDRMFRVNVTGGFLCAQAAARHMVEAGRGRIVFVASTAALMAEPLLAACASAKGVIISLTRVMALELAPHNVTVNAIVPGTTVTGMTSAYTSRHSS